VFYAGGGGGCGLNENASNPPVFASLSSAGAGRGGANNSDNGTVIFATSATANTGSGGGGAANRNSANPAGNGGSGIVIIRYPATQSPPASFGGANTPQISYADGYQIYTWTSSGTVTF
jgi:hypothetical protein